MVGTKDRDIQCFNKPQARINQRSLIDQSTGPGNHMEPQDEVIELRDCSLVCSFALVALKQKGKSMETC